MMRALRLNRFARFARIPVAPSHTAPSLSTLRLRTLGLLGLGLLTLALGACGGAPPPLAAGRWIGTVIPQGEAAHGPANEEVCAGPTRGVLTFRGRRFQFEPNEGTLVLPGFIDGTGKLTASLVRPGANHQAWVATFTGAVKGRRLEGLLALPGCRADVRLDHQSGPNIIDDLLRE